MVDVCALVGSIRWPKGVPKPVRSVVMMERRYRGGNKTAQTVTYARLFGPLIDGAGSGTSVVKAVTAAVVDYASRYDKTMDAEKVARKLRSR